MPADKAESEFLHSPRSSFGGYVDTFRMRSVPVRFSVYCPPAAMGAHEVDVLVFAHGLLNVCKPAPKNPPEDLVSEAPFRLGQLVDGCGRALVLIVPLFEWSGKMWLGEPEHLNALVEETREHLAGLLGAPPAVANLILAGHSRAYSFLEPLARNFASPQMREGALSRLAEIWMLDSTYGGDVSNWMGLMAKKPGLNVKVFYRKGSKTSAFAQALASRARESAGRLVVTGLDPVQIGHCEVPGSQLPGLLRRYAGDSRSVQHELDFESHRPSLRRKILEIAEQEWQNWKQGTIAETAAEAVPLLTRYWDAVGVAPTPEQLRSTVWQAAHPWSAAFVSCVIRAAGAGKSFGYSASHTGYIAAAKRAAQKHDVDKFQAFPIDEAPLEPGDVVCHDRPERPSGPCAGTNFENAGTAGHMVSHGEIVLEVNAAGGYAITIGGNTSQEYPSVRGALGGNTVGKHKVAIDHHGYCIASQKKCPYFAVLKPPPESGEHELRDAGRWSWMSPDAEARRLGGVQLEEDVHDPSVTETRAIRITVVGHASARWRGARNPDEANRLNDALSNRRADNVRAFVEQILRRQLPGVPILPGSSPAPGQHPTGLQAGSYGVGSRQPVAPSANPKENDPRNRSVQILIELTTTQHGVNQVSLAPKHINARTDNWYGKVLSLKGAAIGAAGYRLEMTIRNPLSNKLATYAAYLGGGGVGGPAWLSGSDLEDEFSFTTDHAMGFGDFDGQWIRVERVGGSFGVEIMRAYLTFVGLGDGAAMLRFQKSTGFGLKRPDAEGFVASGKLSLQGQNPGDWYEVDGGTDTVPFAVDHNVEDGMILTFPTGKASMRDIKAAEKTRLSDFVKKWAQQL